MKKIISYLVGCFILTTTYSQATLDTLIYQTKTDSLGGRLPTYYTPGNKSIALDIQNTILAAIKYYELKLSKKFEVKLAVLDSAQWLQGFPPYGFVFYHEGWMVMNTGMPYERFEDVYGLQSFSSELKKSLKRNRISEKDMIWAFYKVYSIHELGHYFIDRLSTAKSPNSWMNEVIATYFSYEFFTHYQPELLKIFELFHKVDRDYFEPKYTSIKDFNEIYDAMGVKNYLWYHSNFYFLVKSLYKCQPDRFISFYEKIFPKTSDRKFTTSEIAELIDKECNGKVKLWLNGLENKKK